MKNKRIIVAAIICILLSIGWAVKHYVFPSVPSAQPPLAEPITILPPPVKEEPKKEDAPSPAAASSPSKKRVTESRPVGEQHISLDKLVTTDDAPVDLSEHNMSIKKEENKGYQISPNVNVKSGVVHVQLDQENSRSIEIERNPANSNSDYQVMVRKKF